ncbi:MULTISPECIES: nucleoside-diphosphate kinase [Auritidibacter]|uniref:nucleoside-diphosphate kinase n=1 Tax=Auritidibacter TaxID=1160973 RepID=UPI000D733B4B|nr:MULTISPECIES: nucleoside-diphosphate kinase [Auritidibacter]AXR73367.1 nucleoside-diphosphate kinase [Auritidibacter sp. NML130574]NIH70847.1 nucleoside-diphosphate kinase [Auritidibacter ignavus]PXA82123.1 nucleoside-diphosphate kinase [Auritidibacter sp. NML120636]RMX24029.1 nucleoside-diphosphate kinase [Auritidibacter ignavus]WGH81941.1 nucleoside-diphosphate kinase [Auritidibacter ignavus]
MATPERSLILIKPDGVKRGLVGEILTRIEHKGYRIVELEMMTANPEMLADHYEEHQGKEFFPALVEFMSSGPLVAAIVEGDRVIEGIRALTGKTDPTVALPGTIRGDFGRDWGPGVQQNLIHASDSTLSAEREMEIWFGWNRAD